MKQFIRTFYCFTIMLLAAAGLRAQEGYTDRARKYAETYAKMAMEEQRRSGIPAAITLGQGILETEAGLSELMTQANNHFGIKCKSDWSGDKFLHTDDAPNECFKRYSCAAESYKDHSDYLHRNQRYAKLFTLSITDYKRWAVCLRQCGYATNPQYAQQLIKIIENFNLHSYTLSALDSNLLQQGATVMEDEEDEVGTAPKTAGSESAPASLPDAKVLKINDLKAIYAHKGESLRPYGAKFKIPYSRLLEMNDLPEGPLQFDTYIYLEKKKTLGVRPVHIVKDDETVLMVSQMEGIQLKRLMAMNMLQPNEEPVNGAKLYLQSATAHKPEVRVGATVAHTTDAIVSDTDPVKTTPDNDEIPTTKAPVQTPVVQAPVPTPAAAPAAVEPVVTAPVEAPVVPTSDPAQPPVDAPATAVAAPAPPAAPTVATGSAAIPAETAQAPVQQPAAVTPPNQASTQKHVIVVNTEEDTPPPPAGPTPQQIQHEQDSLAKEAELNDLKASLDKVVYADDSKLLAKTTTTTTEGGPKATRAAEPKDAEPKAAGGPKYYTVKKGDTAFGIAKRNNITIEELYEMNHITASGVKIGKKLRVQ